MHYLSGAAATLRSSKSRITSLAIGSLSIGSLSMAMLATSAQADSSPQVLMTPTNQPAACVTPGRLMAFVRDRNPALRDRFAKIAVAYMKHGEALNIRWDFAFFQMMLETANLKFNGDVNWTQNNFAGLGATGNGVKGERFGSVSDGVRAHLEHLLIYAGVRVDNPVADRTRKVQSWNILAPWQNSIRGPMTFGHIGQKWAPGDRGYTADINSIAKAFAATRCHQPDPQRELLAEALGGKQQRSQRIADTRTTRDTRQSLTRRASLGAATVYRRTESVTLPTAKPQNSDPAVSYTPPTNPRANSTAKLNILNKNAAQTAGTVPPLTPKAGADAEKPTKVATAGQLAAKFATPWLKPSASQNKPAAETTAPAPTKCRVWTASYGGQKAIIIKSADTSHINYTVLDVNAGRENREAAAYISAYAKGGKKIGEFKSQTMALDKAFKLCPDS